MNLGIIELSGVQRVVVNKKQLWERDSSKNFVCKQTGKVVSSEAMAQRIRHACFDMRKTVFSSGETVNIKNGRKRKNVFVDSDGGCHMSMFSPGERAHKNEHVQLWSVEFMTKHVRRRNKS